MQHKTVCHSLSLLKFIKSQISIIGFAFLRICCTDTFTSGMSKIKFTSFQNPFILFSWCYLHLLNTQAWNLKNHFWLHFFLNIFYWLCYYSCPNFPLCPPLPGTSLLSSRTPLSSCPWVMSVSSLAFPFPILFSTSPCLFCTYQLCCLIPVPFPPFLPFPLPTLRMTFIPMILFLFWLFT